MRSSPLASRRFVWITCRRQRWRHLASDLMDPQTSEASLVAVSDPDGIAILAGRTE
ncbi:hypothetical protein [Salinarchaeum laminariae]|uniref:hypothetical protein n=1 Tax=Salinarchaeum laminariae TaxID=869888 RepID=UPI0020BF2A02|nr:hypothetical protein [Salinarchaeum laminariae]